jgi:hypothetical protein
MAVRLNGELGQRRVRPDPVSERPAKALESERSGRALAWIDDVTVNHVAVWSDQQAQDHDDLSVG